MSKNSTLINILARIVFNSTITGDNLTMSNQTEINIAELTAILSARLKKNFSIEDVAENNSCDGFIKDVANFYSEIHGYLSLIVCTFGTVANVFNIAVLTRKDMACTPVNRILTGLAVADMIVMIEYIPFTYYFYILRRYRFDYPYAVYFFFHTNFSQVLHTISICLTLGLAVWRYIAIRHPDKSHTLCTEYRCTLAITISYLLPVFLCSPSYAMTSIKQTQIIENGKKITLYHLGLSDFATANNAFLIFTFWTYSVVIKLIPCLMLTLISYWLVRALCQTQKRKNILRGYNCPSIEEKVERRTYKCERRTERTTRMLVAVLMLFLITEFPQGILGLLSGVWGEKFYKNCYHLTGDFMDILALLNGAINFILYCCMSRQFRMTFGQLFKPKMLVKRAPCSQTDLQSTYV